MQKEIEAIDAVAEVVNRIKRHGTTAEFTLANGIVLLIKPVPPYLMTAINDQFQPPPPPTVYIEDKGRDEPNPNHPDYIKILEDLENKKRLAITDMVLAVGTEFVSVPEGYYGPDEDQWIDKVNFVNSLLKIEIKVDKEDKVKRYLNWLRFYALESTSDVLLIQQLPYEVAGIREDEVDAIINSFRGLPERGPDTDSESSPVSLNGNSANRAARRASARNRGT